MYSIGVIAVASSLQNIMQIDAELQKYCNVTYLPYSSNEHMIYVYRQNADRFDALLFGGKYTYHVIRDNVGAIRCPHAFFSVADRDYYRVIAQIAIERPGQDFSRVYFDKPDSPVNFEAVFGRADMPLLEENDDPDISYGEFWEIAWQHYQKLWNSKRADCFVTRFGSMEEKLREAKICFRLLQPSRESMMDTFLGLLMQIKEAPQPNAAASLGIVAPRDFAEPAQMEALFHVVEQCNRQLGEIFLIYRYEKHLELTTNNNLLQELTRQYTVCPLRAVLERSLEFPVSVGWGCAKNIIDAHRNAARARKEAGRQDGFASFTVTGEGCIIGPMAGAARELSADGREAELDIRPTRRLLAEGYREKLLDALAGRADSAISAPELAEVIRVTVRSAARILAQLESGGAAVAFYKHDSGSRGRPVKYYRIDAVSLL